MTEKILNKDVIAVADLSGLPMKEKNEKIGTLGKLMKDNPEIVPTIKPVAADVMEGSAALAIKMIAHKAMDEALKAFTKEINGDLKDLSDIIVKKWLPQVDDACAGDIVLMNKLGYTAKNTKVTIEASKGRASHSNPIISNVDTSKHMKHKIFVINSETGGTKKPVDALQTSILGQIGGVAPVDFDMLPTIGIIDRGNVVIDFKSADIGKPIYYIAAYIDKKTKKIIAVSPVYTAFIG